MIENHDKMWHCKEICVHKVQIFLGKKCYYLDVNIFLDFS